MFESDWLSELTYIFAEEKKGKSTEKEILYYPDSSLMKITGQLTLWRQGEIPDRIEKQGTFYLFFDGEDFKLVKEIPY